MKPRQRPRRPNIAARALADPKYRKRVVKAKKGKASYTRKGRQAYPDALSFLLSSQSCESLFQQANFRKYEPPLLIN